MDVKELKTFPQGFDLDKHWYYAHKTRVLHNCISDLYVKTVLDVGAGSGFFARKVLERESVERAICVDIAYPESRRESLPGVGSIEYRNTGADITCDLALFMDVLEHVDDDQGMLEEYLKCITKGGYVFITVPAFMFMWSGHDEYLGHVRRYTLSQLTELVSGAGLDIERSGYCYSAVFPLALGQRLGSRLFSVNKEPKSTMKQHVAWLNNLLARICRFESQLLPLNPWFGLSVLCLARK